VTRVFQSNSHFGLSTIREKDRRKDDLWDRFQVEVLARKPDSQLYALTEDHLIEIVRDKFPARDGEPAVTHLERALIEWIEGDDVVFTGAAFEGVVVGEGKEAATEHEVDRLVWDELTTEDDPVDLSGLEVSHWYPPQKKNLTST
jgi:hypothetical protein